MDGKVTGSILGPNSGGIARDVKSYDIFCLLSQMGGINTQGDQGEYLGLKHAHIIAMHSWDLQKKGLASKGLVVLND